MRPVKYLVIALIATSVVSGCADNSTDNQNDTEDNRVVPEEQINVQDQVQTPGQLNTQPSGEPDKYGRQPGDAHYGHDHPIQDDQNNQSQGSPVIQPQDNATGGPDKYGRKPGDEHYGHDHPIQDDVKNIQAPQTSPVRVPK